MSDSQRRTLAAFVLPVLAFALAMTAARTRAQPEVALDADGAVRRALEGEPTLRAAAIEAVRARALVEGEEARYQLVLRLEGSANVGQTPSLTVGRVIFPYSETIDLAAELERAFPWGMVVTLRAEGSRAFRRAAVIPTMPTVVELGPGYGFDLSLAVSQPLLRGFGDEVGEAELRSARADRSRADLAEARAASELVRDVLLAFWELWYAHAAVHVEEHARDLAMRRHDDARARVELGAGETADALAFATTVASAEEAVAAALATLGDRALELGRLTGTGRAALDAEAGDPAWPAAPSAEAVARALDASPELAVLRAEVESARVAARTAGEPLRPRLDLSASIAVHGLGYDDVGQTFSQVGTFAAVTGMVSLTYETPLEDARLHRTEERARLAVDAAEERLRAAAARIESQVRSAMLAEESAVRRLELAEETARIAAELVRAEEGRRELGTATAVDVLDAEDEVRRAELRAARARADVARARVTLRSLTGELLSDYAVE